MFDFEKYSFSQIATFAGFCVGCIFATYVIRTFGYFSVMGEQFTGIFLEANLLQGAILATPSVFLTASLLFWSVWLASLMIDLDEQITYVASKIPGIVKVRPRLVMNCISLALVACLFIPAKYFDGDNFILKVMLSIFIVFIQFVFLFDRWIDTRKLSPLLLASTLLVTYSALHDVGKFQAIEDLNHAQNGFSITATDKNYVNVSLLRTSSTSILFRAGNSILLYDRTKITKIERMTDKIVQH